MFVPHCSAHTRPQRNKNGQKSLFLLQAVTAAGVLPVTNIAKSLFLSQLVTLEGVRGGTNIDEFAIRSEKMQKSQFLFHSVPPALAQIGTEIAHFGRLAKKQCCEPESTNRDNEE
jgi:hypothetical protein